MTWQPILDGGAAEDLAETLRCIEATLEESFEDVREPSLSMGYAGLALFHGYMAAACNSERAASLAEARLDTAIDLASQHPLPVGLFNGLAGIAWTSQHLQRLLTGAATAGASSDVDDVLFDLVQTKPWTWEYDLVHGLVGLGRYALDHPDESFARGLLHQILDRLAETALEQGSGLTWFTNRNPLEGRDQHLPEAYHCLGLAHGVPGVVGFLARVLMTDFLVARQGEVEVLLQKAVTWLLAQKRPGGQGSVFSYHALPQSPSARSAWCYGDPGVAAVLLSAGLAVDRPDWTGEAIAIAEKDCARPLDESGVVDAELCHGAAGLGHLYNRLYQATQNQNFFGAAKRWFERVQVMRRPGMGVAGYSSWWPESRDWHSQSGFLTGAAGIGLSLLAAISPLSPDWDRLLLLDLPLKRSRPSGANP